MTRASLIASKHRRTACIASAAVLVTAMVAIGVPQAADDAEGHADHVISSVADIARNLRLTNVPGAIEVRADSLEFDYQKGKLEYAGSVLVTHSGVTIRADRVTVSFKPREARSLENITASGSVIVVRGDETAEGERAVYDPKAATVVLSENARLGSGPNLLTGERVVVYLDEGRARVESGRSARDKSHPGAPAAGADPATADEEPKRVRVVIMPDTVEDVDVGLHAGEAEPSAAETEASPSDTEAGPEAADEPVAASDTDDAPSDAEPSEGEAE